MYTHITGIKSFVAIVCATLLLASCQKDNNDQNNTPPDYSPMTAGSTWTYQDSTGFSYTLTATSRDTVALGRTYKVFTSTTGVNNYYAKSGNDYYRFGNIPGVTANGFEELYLKDNQSVNALWQGVQTITVPGAPFPLDILQKYTIKEKGITRTVNNKTYNDVIHVRLDLSNAILGSLGGGDFYYAGGVGMIESSIAVVLQGTPVANSKEILTSYTIK
jgi:hypothetical protein